MSILFAFIVLCAAIVGFFLNEWTALFQRIFSITALRLILPLLFASFIVESYALWGWKALTILHQSLVSFEFWLVHMLPFHMGALFATRVFILVLFALMPILIVKWFTRKSPFTESVYWAYCVSAFVWVMLVILLINLGL